MNAGPIGDDPAERSPAAAHWDSAYRTKSPELVSWFQARPKRSLAMIRAAQLDVDAPIIDVGGGASVLVDYLLMEGYRDLTVLDVSEAALGASQRRLGSAAARVHWMVTDVRAFRPRRHYALWHDRALFHFLTEPGDQTRYADLVRRSLRPGGSLVIATFAVGGPRRCSGLEIVQYDAEKLSGILGADFILQEQTNEAHMTPAGGRQLFAWFRYLKV
jgi:SAM-dependent methyltransferase